VLARARWLPEARDNEARGSDAVRSATSRSERRARRQDAADRRLDRSAAGSRGSPWRSTCARDRHPPRPARRCWRRRRVHAMSELKAVLPQADFVALTCQLTEETEKVIDADALGRIKPSAERANRLIRV
jgi:hypothetical protein